MNSILHEMVALDTNEFIFALRQETTRPDCKILLFDKLNTLHVYMPLQILIELQRNLNAQEMRGMLLALTKAKAVSWDYSLVPRSHVQRWEARGAKKGDAVIAAQLEAADVHYFISENRHFLSELPNLPFQVLTSEQAVRQLG